jgi:hypothetical protein
VADQAGPSPPPAPADPRPGRRTRPPLRTTTATCAWHCAQTRVVRDYLAEVGVNRGRLARVGNPSGNPVVVTEPLAMSLPHVDRDTANEGVTQCVGVIQVAREVLQTWVASC